MEVEVRTGQDALTNRRARVRLRRDAIAARGPADGHGAPPAPRPAVTLDMVDPGVDHRARRRALRAAMGFWLGFLALVATPTGLSGWYLFAKAADQYASTVSFAVRSLDGATSSPMADLFGAGADSTAGDSQMLFEYLQSQPMAATIDAAVDLRALYNRPEADAVFRLGDERSIEDLVTYWNRAVGVAHDTAAGIIHVEVRAFRPDDAQAVAAMVLAESERLINTLSTGARADAVRFAEIDLAQAETRVRDARLALQGFRSTQGTADISGDIRQEMALIAGLRAQRSSLQSDYDSRRGLLGAESPVLTALTRRVASLDAQIAEAEGRIAEGPRPDGAPPARPTLADAAGEQERLQVELELAVNMYTAAQAGLEAARAEARRTQRYLATHIAPTLSEVAEHPRRAMWTLAVFGVALLGWAILLLVIGAIRDRT